MTDSEGRDADSLKFSTHGRPPADEPVPETAKERFTEAEVEAAVARLSDSESFAEAERIISRAAPGLQRILAGALGEGGWFGESHEAELLKAATAPDSEERLTAVRTMLAEEARIGMMVGVAVGWSLHTELLGDDSDADNAEVEEVSATDPVPRESKNE